jgi:hypothetical protein
MVKRPSDDPAKALEKAENRRKQNRQAQERFRAKKKANNVDKRPFAEPRMYEIIKKWDDMPTTVTHSMGRNVLNKVFQLRPESLKSLIHISGIPFPRPTQVYAALMTDLVVDRKALQICNSEINGIDKSANLDSIIQGLWDSQSRIPYTALGFEATAQGILSWKPKVPQQSNKSNEILVVANRGKWVSVVSGAKAITDFHIDSYFWGTYLHGLVGTKVLITFPCTDYNRRIYRDHNQGARVGRFSLFISPLL